MDHIFYNSTRGGGEGMLSSEAILRGIAEDGGLFVPDSIPDVSGMLKTLRGMDFKALAYFIISRYFTDFEEEELRDCIDKAYGEKFDTPEIAPVEKVGDAYLLELFHGPTLAFKDMALSILPYLLKTAARKRNIQKEIVILTATSGDTGKAALEGFSDVEGTKIIVFFPEEGVSQIQKRQMTTHQGDNTYVIGVKGNFDDAQNGVKSIFNDREFGEVLDKNNYMFSSANSINIGRLIPQIVYYFYGYFNIVKKGGVNLGEKVNIVVPTGNFGNILAAFYAKDMGLPINKLICASNENKVLYDFIKTGEYDRTREFITTISPSMDILISSNLERFLYFISCRDPLMVNKLMEGLKYKGVYEITSGMKDKLKDFYGGFAHEDETRNAIKEVWNKYGYLMDTHTAVAYHVYRKYMEDTGDSSKTIIASTASPFKFTSSVMTSIDEKYGKLDDFELLDEMADIMGTQVPAAIKDINNRPRVHKALCSKEDMKSKVSEVLKL